jgi:predicted nucleotidyltransferase
MPAPPAEIRAILRDVARIVRHHLPDPQYRVFLYGSWATGRAQRGSDVDIGIEGMQPVPAAALAGIREECEALATLYSVEVVDFARMAEGIRRHARGRILEAEAA